MRVGALKIWLDPKDKKRVDDIIQKLQNEQQYLKAYIHGAYDVNLEWITPAKKNKVYQDLKILEKIETTLSKLIQLEIYFNMNAYGKIESLIESIITKDYHFSFFIQEHNLNYAKELNQKIVKMLNRLYSVSEDKQLIETLVAYLLIKASENLRELILDDFEAPNRLSYVRSRIKSLNYGQKYPFVWIPWIEKFSSYVELEKYLISSKVLGELSKQKIDVFALFQSYVPKDKSIRKALLSRYQKLASSKLFYHQDLKYRVWDNPNFSKLLLKELSGVAKPLFIKKRRFYKNMLDSNKAIMYSTFSLFKLGDIEKDYYIKVLAVKAAK